jgi:acyl dehydratase
VVHAEITVTEIKPSRSKPDRGFVTIAYETVTRTGEIRQRTTATLLMFARPSLPSPSDSPRS